MDLESGVKDDDEQVEPQDRSERLKKDNNLTTSEKIERQAIKKNLDGNISHYNHVFYITC